MKTTRQEVTIIIGALYLAGGRITRSCPFRVSPRLRPLGAGQPARMGFGLHPVVA